MTQMPQQPDILARPRRPRRRRRVRPVWILVPLTCLVCIWLLTTIDPSFSFADVMRLLGVRHTARYCRLATLAALGVGVVLMVKVLRRRRP